MSSPFFSIILPTYNRANFISKAIESCINQTFIDWELIIVDDGSTDDTQSKVSMFKDSRIYYHFQKNQERSVARNNGFNYSKGNYICYLDSDDWFDINHLEILYNEIKKTNFQIALYHTYQKYIRNGLSENFLIPPFFPYSNLSKSDNLLLRYVWLFSPPVQTIAVHRLILSEISFDTYPIPNECYDFIGQIVSKYQIFEISEWTVCMVSHQDNSTAWGTSFLLNSIRAFEFIINRQIYKNVKNHKLVKNTFRDLSLGLSGCYAEEKNKKEAWKYLKKALGYGFKFSQLRQMIGIIRRLFF